MSEGSRDYCPSIILKVDDANPLPISGFFAFRCWWALWLLLWFSFHECCYKPWGTNILTSRFEVQGLCLSVELLDHLAVLLGLFWSPSVKLLQASRQHEDPSVFRAHLFSSWVLFAVLACLLGVREGWDRGLELLWVFLPLPPRVLRLQHKPPGLAFRVFWSQISS